MTKTSLYIIIATLLLSFIAFGYTFTKLLNEIEASAISTLDTYCGPETAKQYKLRGHCDTNY